MQLPKMPERVRIRLYAKGVSSITSWNLKDRSCARSLHRTTMTISSVAALVGTMLILAIAPGPSDFAVVARSIAAGLAQGLLMVGGIVVADLLFILVAVHGLAEVAQSLDRLFALVKYACGAYLIFLGITSLRPRTKVADVSEVRKASGYSSFFGGLLITLGDPKAILFYMGLFPAFVDLSKVSLADTTVIMMIAIIVVGSVKAIYACLAERAKLLFENDAVRRKLDIAAGGVLVCTGLFLLLAR